MLKTSGVIGGAARIAVALACAATLAGCAVQESGFASAKALAPLEPGTLALMEAKGTSKSAGVLIRSYKKESELEVWKQTPDGTYVHLRTYPMCRWSGQLGPKVRMGDRQTPEGFYAVTPGSMNPNSAYYLSFGIGFPNAYDRAWGRTGDSIMVHGICSSAGCFSMTDGQVREIYALVREAFAGGQRSVQVQSFPFRMTAENLAKYRLDPNIAFWRELKHGSDHFEVTRREVPVGVCGKHYVFAPPKPGERLDPTGACPSLAEDAPVEARVVSERDHELTEEAALVARGTRPVRLVYVDGGQNPVFAGKFPDVSRPEALASGPTEVPVSTVAATVPLGGTRQAPPTGAPVGGE